MKTCRKYRKQIVWRAAAVLEEGEARTLSAHLETCAGCRAYLAEISAVTERLAAAEANPAMQASGYFHRELTARLQVARPQSIREILAAGFRRAQLNWRVALPIMAASVLAVATFIAWRHPVKLASPSQVNIQAASPSAASPDLAPTIANYQKVAGESLDKLDDLLTRQGRRNLPPVPPLSVATLLGANAPE